LYAVFGIWEVNQYKDIPIVSSVLFSGVEGTLLLITVTVNMYVSLGVKLFIVTELSLPRGTSSTEGGEHGELHLTFTLTESHTVLGLGLLHVILAVFVLPSGDNSAFTLVTGEGATEERGCNTLTTSYRHSTINMLYNVSNKHKLKHLAKLYKML